MFGQSTYPVAARFIAPHPQLPLVAVCKEDGSLDIISMDNFKPLSRLHKDSRCCLMTWHPAKATLAASWVNGVITVWSETDGMWREGILHHSEITCLVWSPRGSRLISGDNEGDVTVWKVDVRGKLSSLCQYRLKSGIHHCLFRSSKVKAETKQYPDCPSFFMTGKNGKVYFADDNNHCSESGVFGAVRDLKYIEKTDTIVLITEDFSMLFYSISGDGKLNLENEIKVSSVGLADKHGANIAWIEDSILAMSLGSPTIRMIDIMNEDNVTLQSDDKSAITSLAYCKESCILAASTEAGRVLLWRMTKGGPDQSATWTILTSIPSSSPLSSISWGHRGAAFVGMNSSSLSVFRKQTRCFMLFKNTFCIQSKPSVLRLERDSGTALEMEIAEPIRQISVSMHAVAMSDSFQIYIFEYADSKPIPSFPPPLTHPPPSPDLANYKLMSSIKTESLLFAVEGSTLIIAEGNRLDLYTLSSVLRGSIGVVPAEGSVTHLCTSQNVVAYGTSEGHIRVYDVSRREPKSLASFPAGGKIGYLALNSNGTFVAYTLNRELDGNLDKSQSRSFNMSGISAAGVKLIWDTLDPRQFALETVDDQVLIFFFSDEAGVILHDKYTKSSDNLSFVGSSLPFHYFAEVSDEAPRLKKITLPDFIDLDEANTSVITAIVDFCYLVDLGNLDIAFKSLSRIENDRVWKNLAKICVKKGRLDVALTSLSHIGHAAAVAAVRRAASTEKSTALKTAIVAKYLGMHDEVERIYTACNRFDLLNRYYQELGQWDKALEVASKRDRINLRTTYIQFAQYLLENEDRVGSAAALEKSGSPNLEIPLMFSEEEGDLQMFSNAANEKNLKKWWGQFEESRGNFSSALKIYEEIRDTLSVVRIHCFCGNLQTVSVPQVPFLTPFTKAEEICKTSGNKAAGYFLARQYEKEKKISQAIEFYSAAQCFSQAVRLAKEHKHTNLLVNLALQGTKDLMLDVARQVGVSFFNLILLVRYFETSGNHLDKAITLYHRAGQLDKAIEMCFALNQLPLLEEIAYTLGPDSDPATLEKCAAFFANGGQYDRAVILLCDAKKFKDALHLLSSKGIHVTDAIGEKFSFSDDPTDKEKALLAHLGDLCLQQKSYHLACKKFAQAGERTKAMKALLKSGDVDRIIFFANVLGPKQKDIFVMAANFLQTLDWRNNHSVMKAIVGFYSKARAFDSLAGFYESCSQMEIDEYQNYEKAMAALQESLKCLTKSKDTDSVLYKRKLLQTRLHHIEQYLTARRLSRTDPFEMLRLCEALLDEPDIESSIRVGDIYALMIESHYARGNVQAAKEVFEVMGKKIPHGSFEFYLDTDLLRALGATYAHHDDDVPEEEDFN
ncbi:hypothetical protein HDU96_008104 [Phlyctochytrium bullatum]|nr:hypothetical protein HDU96_008104 [Phlyctochytrium bullatum]